MEYGTSVPVVQWFTQTANVLIQTLDSDRGGIDETCMGHRIMRKQWDVERIRGGRTVKEHETRDDHRIKNPVFQQYVLSDEQSSTRVGYSN